MNRLEELEDAIERLSPEDYQLFEQWFLDRQNARWDASLDRDSVSGKLDFLFVEASEESSGGPLREWPPAK